MASRLKRVIRLRVIDGKFFLAATARRRDFEVRVVYYILVMERRHRR
jgi:hypothetical protein